MLATLVTLILSYSTTLRFYPRDSMVASLDKTVVSSPTLSALSPLISSDKAEFLASRDWYFC